MMVIFSINCVKSDRYGLTKRGVANHLWVKPRTPVKTKQKTLSRKKVTLQKQNKLPSLFWSKRLTDIFLLLLLLFKLLFYILILCYARCIDLLKVQLFWKGHKNLKNLPLVLTLLSKNNCFVKTGWRFFQILWPSHNVWTLSIEPKKETFYIFFFFKFALFYNTRFHIFILLTGDFGAAISIYFLLLHSD